MKKPLLLLLPLLIIPLIILTRPKYSGRVEQITIGNVEGYPNLALIASEKGFFKDYGLEVTFKNYDTPKALIDDLLEGNIDLVSASAEFLVVRNSFANNNLRILATVSRQDNYWELVARRDQNTLAPKDLRGKTIAVSKGTVGEFLLAQFLSSHSLTPQDVKVVDMPLKQRIEQLVTGDLDAVVILSPYTEQLKDALGEKTLAWSIQLDRPIFSLTYATSDFAAKNPQVIDRYLQALLKTQKFVDSHNSQARAIMQQSLDLSEHDINSLWPHFTFDVALEPNLLTIMEQEAKWLIDNNLVQSSTIPNYSDIIYSK